MLIEGLEVGPRCMVRLECSRPAEESYLRSSSDGSVAPSLMLLLGISACTAAEPRSAATPTVPRTSGHRDDGGPPQLGHGSSAAARQQEKRGRATARSCRCRDLGERAALQRHRERSSALPDRAGGARRQPDPLIRRDPSQPAELSRAVLRVTQRRDQQRLPTAVSEGRQPGPSTPSGWIQLRRLGRVHAQGGLHRMHVGSLPASTTRGLTSPTCRQA